MNQRLKNPQIILNNCKSTTTSLVKFITGSLSFELDTHIATVSLAKDQHRVSLNEYFNGKFNALLPQLNPLQQRAVLRAKEFNLSGWLSVIPLERDQFYLSPQEFRDALALRYRKPTLNLPWKL